MKSYKLRVDLDTLGIDVIIDLVKKYSSIYAYCLEGGDENPHTHFYVQSDMALSNLRSSLRKLGLKGNASYSIKELEEEYPIEYIAYMMKERKFKNVGIPTEVIDEAEAYNLKVKTEIKVKKENKKTIIVKLKEYLDDECPEWTTDFNSYQQRVMALIVQYHVEHDLLIRRFAITSYYDTLACKYVPFYFTQFATKLLEKF